ncbi:MAG: urea transporter [Rhodocyclales bacterium]|nr:urea transporter [Rhodocyclales bacterium]
MNATLPAQSALVRFGRSLAKTYAAVFFCHSPWVGAWFAALTWWTPRAALGGLTGLLAAALWARLFRLPTSGRLHLVNGLLCGLVIGAFHSIDGAYFLWIVLAALLSTLLAHWLAGLFWKIARLPVLSLPFVLACWAVFLAWQVNAPSALPLGALAGGDPFLPWPWLDNFFISLGWLLLIPYPAAGALVFAGILAASRYLALLAAAGYAAGTLTLHLLGSGEATPIAFNFSLAAMALGGFFVVPGRTSFLMALAGSALTGWLAIVLEVLLHPLHLPLLTMPFLGVACLMLGSLGARLAARQPILMLDSPASPEINTERARLAEARGGAADSLPLQPPFHGEWRVTQGFDGPHTHKPPWQHALDFDIAGSGGNHAGSGALREDYFCFGAPVLAPIAGQVVRLRDDLADTVPGEIDVANNWGNFILLRTGAAHVLLAHLKRGSIKVHIGEWVSSGQQVAACGSSGRSPVPHLHLQVQRDDELGSLTRPFHMTNVLVRNESHAREFRLFHLPAPDDEICTALSDERLANAMRLSRERLLTYSLHRSGGESERATLRATLTLLGQSRLETGTGASAAYEETAAVLGFYDRNARPDPMLDLWLLAVGLTPFSAIADQWSDRPTARLLPLSAAQRLLCDLLHPLGASCDSQYRRKWDEASGAWLQDGGHFLRIAPGLDWRCETRAWIAPGLGVRRLQLDAPGVSWKAELQSAE